MVTLDWDALRKFVKERKPVEVSAGILTDWFWTGATVYENGKFKRNHKAYTTTSWASPGFKATMENGDIIEVYAEREEKEDERIKREADMEKSRARLKKVSDYIQAKNKKKGWA